MKAVILSPLAKAVAAQTFGEAADAYVEAMRSQWKSEKHAEQWVVTLREYAAPIRSMPVADIGVDAVLTVLKPIWQTKPETASRLRGRIESVLDAARAKGQRSGENPARWRGHLDRILPPRAKLSRGHHEAMAIDDLPDFVTRIRDRAGISARALEFAILTAARTGEVIGARWDELDFSKGLWTIPAERMKAGRTHRVPLSAAATTLLRSLSQGSAEGFVFPGSRPGKPLSNMSMDKVLRLEKAEATVHGFRSTFKDWATERTSFAGELSEVALAHVVRDKTEAAYRRGDMMERRRELMEAWAQFCGGAADRGVVRLVARA